MHKNQIIYKVHTLFLTDLRNFNPSINLLYTVHHFTFNMLHEVEKAYLLCRICCSGL